MDPLYIASKAEGMALLAATSEKTLVLQNAPGSHAYLGLPYIQTMMQQIQEAYPNIDSELRCDAGDNAAFAITAMEKGFDSICFSGVSEVADKLRTIAQRKEIGFYYHKGEES